MKDTITRDSFEFQPEEEENVNPPKATAPKASVQPKPTEQESFLKGVYTTDILETYAKKVQTKVRQAYREKQDVKTVLSPLELAKYNAAQQFARENANKVMPTKHQFEKIRRQHEKPVLDDFRTILLQANTNRYRTDRTDKTEINLTSAALAKTVRNLDEMDQDKLSQLRKDRAAYAEFCLQAHNIFSDHPRRGKVKEVRTALDTALGIEAPAPAPKVTAETTTPEAPKEKVKIPSFFTREGPARIQLTPNAAPTPAVDTAPKPPKLVLTQSERVGDVSPYSNDGKTLTLSRAPEVDMSSLPAGVRTQLMEVSQITTQTTQRPNTMEQAQSSSMLSRIKSAVVRPRMALAAAAAFVAMSLPLNNIGQEPTTPTNNDAAVQTTQAGVASGEFESASTVNNRAMAQPQMAETGPIAESARQAPAMPTPAVEDKAPVADTSPSETVATATQTEEESTVETGETPEVVAVAATANDGSLPTPTAEASINERVAFAHTAFEPVSRPNPVTPQLQAPSPVSPSLPNFDMTPPAPLELTMANLDNRIEAFVKTQGGEMTPEINVAVEKINYGLSADISGHAQMGAQEASVALLNTFGSEAAGNFARDINELIVSDGNIDTTAERLAERDLGRWSNVESAYKRAPKPTA